MLTVTIGNSVRRNFHTAFFTNQNSCVSEVKISRLYSFYHLA